MTGLSYHVIPIAADLVDLEFPLLPESRLQVCANLVVLRVKVK